MRMRRRSKGLMLIVASCVLITLTAAPAQTREGKNSVNGVVRDAETRAPLINVNVFLSGTKIGIGTNTNGVFSLRGIPSGKYDVVFSHVGYERVVRSVMLKDSSALTLDIQLKQRIITVSEVEVVGKSADEWRRSLPIFLEEFLGKTANAKRCQVLNPEVVNFSVDSSGILSASSDSTVVVENRALGYKLYVELISFRYDLAAKSVQVFYYPRFQELAPANADDAERWRLNRSKSYLGSKRHFFSSLFHRTLSNEGFTVSVGRSRDLVRGPGLILTDSLPVQYSIDGSACELAVNAVFLDVDCLRVDFRSGFPKTRLDDYGSSLIQPRYSRIRIVHGELDDPRSIAVLGRWARERIADELPLEYVQRE